MLSIYIIYLVQNTFHPSIVVDIIAGIIVGGGSCEHLKISGNKKTKLGNKLIVYSQPRK